MAPPDSRAAPTGADFVERLAIRAIRRFSAPRDSRDPAVFGASRFARSGGFRRLAIRALRDSVIGPSTLAPAGSAQRLAAREARPRPRPAGNRRPTGKHLVPRPIPPPNFRPILSRGRLAREAHPPRGALRARARGDDSSKSARFARDGCRARTRGGARGRLARRPPRRPCARAAPC
jgi:hypothetical protein